MSETPRYTPAEEFANAFTHAIGALLAIYGIVMLTYYSKTPLQTASTAIFGATLFLLFQSSTLYHSMVNETAKRVFRKIDHSAIFMLIAGTYTPILLIVMPFPLSVALLAMIWYICISGIVFSCMTLKFKYLSTGLYLLLGWLSVFLMYSIWNSGAHMTVWLMLAGGLFYSFGCIFYLLKYKFMHSIWHLFVLGGAIMHYFAIVALLKAN